MSIYRGSIKHAQLISRHTSSRIYLHALYHRRRACSAHACFSSGGAETSHLVYGGYIASIVSYCICAMIRTAFIVSNAYMYTALYTRRYISGAFIRIAFYRTGDIPGVRCISQAICLVRDVLAPPRLFSTQPVFERRRYTRPR